MKQLKKGMSCLLAVMLIIVSCYSTVTPIKAESAKWDKEVGGAKASVDTTVVYGDNDYSIKIENDDYMCVYIQKSFPVKPHTHYRASIMAKCEGYEVKPNAAGDSGAKMGIPASYTGTECYKGNTWKLLEYSFETEEETTYALALWNGLYGADCKGTVYYSGFQLEEISAEDIKWDRVTSGARPYVDRTVAYGDSEYSIKLVNDDYLCVNIQKDFELKPNTRYVASVMAKNEGYELHPDKTGVSGASLGIPGSYTGSGCYAGEKWKKLSFYFRTDETGVITLALWNGMYAGDCKGTVYYSDFKIEEYIVNTIDKNGISTYSKQAQGELTGTILSNIDADYPAIPKIMQMIATDGIYRIAYSDSKTVYIDLLDSSFEVTKTIKIPKELPMVGNVVMDQKNQYYIIYGENDTDGLGMKTVMTVAKYSVTGELLGKTSYTGLETSLYKDELEWGTMNPFTAARCVAVVDENGVLVVHYGRKMYLLHQSSHTLYIDTKTMEKLTKQSVYVSHSYDQRVITTSDGGYLFAERGDVYPRGIAITKIQKDGTSAQFVPFHFRSGLFYQRTYATIAGLAELSNGYALAGTSVNTLSCKVADAQDDLESRNLFLQVFKKDIKSEYTSNPDAHVLKGEKRVPIETENPAEKGCNPTDIDYGVVWLTDYKDQVYASVPKMMKMNDNSMLLLWEKKLRINEQSSDYLGTYYCIVSNQGMFIKEPTELKNVRLSECTDAIYKDGYVYLVSVNEENYTYGKQENEPGIYTVNHIKIGEYELLNAKKETCMEDGYSGDLYCKETGDTIKGEVILATGHKAAAAVKENVIEATVTAEGSYDEVTYCLICDDELSRAKKQIPKLKDPSGNKSDNNVNVPNTNDGSDGTQNQPMSERITSVTYNQKTVVTNAFKNYPALTKITLSGKVRKMNASAFKGCTKLKTIVIKSTKLTSKNISSKAFKGLSKKVTIKVPKKCYKKYKKLLKKRGFKGKITK